MEDLVDDAPWVLAELPVDDGTVLLPLQEVNAETAPAKISENARRERMEYSFVRNDAGMVVSIITP